jgi:glycosyltransferase involved in cell wall biosynthesis
MRVGIDGSGLISTAGGVRRYVGELVDALARLDSQVHLVVVGAPEGASLPGSAERLPVDRRAPTNLGWSLVDLPRAARRARLDVFHAPAYTAPLHGVHPLVLTIHDVSYERRPEWYPYRRDRLRRWFYRRSARTADMIITDSEFSKREIAAAYRIGPDRIAVVPLGVSAHFFDACAGPAAEGVTEPYLLHVGDLHPRRNLFTLLRALSKLASARIRLDPMLVLVGIDRGERTRLEQEAARSGVRLQLKDHVDESALIRLYAGASAFVYPSRYEGFGLPLLEAMAAGAPVVAARAASIPEVVGDAGLLVDPDDEEELAQCLERVLTDRPLAERLREAGRRRARTFTWDTTAARTLEVYRAVLRATPHETGGDARR